MRAALRVFRASQCALQRYYGSHLSKTSYSSQYIQRQFFHKRKFSSSEGKDEGPGVSEDGSSGVAEDVEQTKGVQPESVDSEQSATMKDMFDSVRENKATEKEVAESEKEVPLSDETDTTNRVSAGRQYPRRFLDGMHLNRVHEVRREISYRERVWKRRRDNLTYDIDTMDLEIKGLKGEDNVKANEIMETARKTLHYGQWEMHQKRGFLIELHKILSDPDMWYKDLTAQFAKELKEIRAERAKPFTPSVKKPPKNKSS
mmetsp:Transcript_12487/g.18637  ORF Transcript_12487/g.18637 Transcript_12487/m.18637 type:complete len:259 (-) Transcript_12487:32-808(-)